MLPFERAHMHIFGAGPPAVRVGAARSRLAQAGGDALLEESPLAVVAREPQRGAEVHQTRR